MYTTVEGVPQLKRLMSEMQRKDSSIIFHLTNKFTRPRPCTINNVNEDFPNEAHLLQGFFYYIKSPKQMIYMFDVTMALTDIEIKQRIKSYLNAKKVYEWHCN